MPNNSLTQKATNAPNLISQSEPPATKEIIVPKMQTDLSILSGTTGSSITPEKRITTSPPIKDPIPNQDKNTLGIEKYQSIPPHIPKFRLGFR